MGGIPDPLGLLGDRLDLPCQEAHELNNTYWLKAASNKDHADMYLFAESDTRTVLGR